MPNLERQLPYLSEKIWTLLKQSIGGFLGVTGFLLSLVMVPIYLIFPFEGKPGDRAALAGISSAPEFALER